jgi:hypothetical protein
MIRTRRLPLFIASLASLLSCAAITRSDADSARPPSPAAATPTGIPDESDEVPCLFRRIREIPNGSAIGVDELPDTLVRGRYYLITGYVVDSVGCPPCPPEHQCEACIDEKYFHLELSGRRDQLPARLELYGVSDVYSYRSDRPYRLLVRGRARETSRPNVLQADLCDAEL